MNKIIIDPVNIDLKRFNDDLEKQDKIDEVQETINAPIQDAIESLKIMDLDGVVVNLKEALYQAEYSRDNWKG